MGGKWLSDHGEIARESEFPRVFLKNWILMFPINLLKSGLRNLAERYPSVILIGGNQQERNCYE